MRTTQTNPTRNPLDLKSKKERPGYNGSWEFFFSAAPTAQNSPEFHFRFINSFIQSSLLGLRVQTFPSPQVHLYYHALKSNFHKFARENVFTNNRSRRSLFCMITYAIFWKTKSVTKSRVHCDFINLSKLSFYLISSIY